MVEANDCINPELTDEIKRIPPTVDQQRTDMQLAASTEGKASLALEEGDADADSVMVLPPSPPPAPVVEAEHAPLLVSPSEEITLQSASPAASEKSVQPKESVVEPESVDKPVQPPSKNAKKVVTALVVDAPQPRVKHEDSERQVQPPPEQPVVKPSDKNPAEEAAQPPAPEAGTDGGGSDTPPPETQQDGAFDDGPDPEKKTDSGGPEGGAEKEAAETSDTPEEASEADDDALTPLTRFMQALFEVHNPLEGDTRTLEERREALAEQRDNYWKDYNAAQPRAVWGVDHPVEDELNVPTITARAEQVRYTASDAEVAAVKSLADQMQETPFRSPTYLTCLYELAGRLLPESTRYGTVIINDHSGRLPGLVMVKLINDERAKAGLAPADVRFVNGRNRYLRRTPEANNFTPAEGRTLILLNDVADATPMNIYDALRENNPSAEVDFAAVAGESPDVWWLDDRTGVSSRVIIGNRSTGSTGLYTDIATLNRGVMEQDDTAVLARQPDRVFDGSAVARARQEAAKVAAAFQELLKNPPVADIISSDDDATKSGLLKDIARRFRKKS